MKLTYIALFMLLVVTFVILGCPQPCLANPLPIEPPEFTQNINPVYLQLLSPLVEAVAVVLILAWKFKLNLKKASLGVFVLVYILNIVTLPITQYLASYLFNDVNHTAIYLAELFPLVVESIFLKLIFNSLYKHNNIVKPVTVKQTILVCLTVNALTFILGLLFYRYFPTWLNPNPFGTNNVIPSPPGR
jgi:hypothetical protein